MYLFKGIAKNPFDNWVVGCLCILHDSTTEKTEYFIQDLNGSKTKVLPESVCRMVYEKNGLKFYGNDIVEYNSDGVRRIEPIIDDINVVFVGRQRNDYAFNILPMVKELNLNIIGNTIENNDLLLKGWSKITIE